MNENGSILLPQESTRKNTFANPKSNTRGSDIGNHTAAAHTPDRLPPAKCHPLPRTVENRHLLQLLIPPPLPRHLQDQVVLLLLEASQYLLLLDSGERLLIFSIELERSWDISIR